MDADGNNAKQLTDGTLEFHAIASPDGRWVFYQSIAGPPTIWKIPSEGGKPQQVIATGYSFLEDVSPNGRQILFLFANRSTPQQRLAIASSNDGSALNVLDVSDWQPDRHAGWTPDGASIAWVRRLNGIENVWVKPLAGGPPRPLTHFDSGMLYSFGWSRDGKTFAVARGQPSSDVVLLRNIR